MDCCSSDGAPVFNFRLKAGVAPVRLYTLRVAGSLICCARGQVCGVWRGIIHFRNLVRKNAELSAVRGCKLRRRLSPIYLGFGADVSFLLGFDLIADEIRARFEIALDILWRAGPEQSEDGRVGK